MCEIQGDYIIAIRLLLQKTSLGHCSGICAMSCIMPSALYTKLDAECDTEVTVISLLLTTFGDGGRAMAVSCPLHCIQRSIVSVINYSN